MLLDLDALMERACKMAGADCSGTIMFGRQSVCLTDEGLARFVASELARASQAPEKEFPETLLDAMVDAYNAVQSTKDRGRAQQEMGMQAALQVYLDAVPQPQPATHDDPVIDGYPLNEGIPPAPPAVSGVASDTEMLDWIEEHASSAGGGNGFTLSVFVPVDSECLRDAIQRAIVSSKIVPTNLPMD